MDTTLTTIDGTRMEALKRAPVSWVERILLASLAVALMLSVAGLTIRALEIGAHQHEIARV